MPNYTKKIKAGTVRVPYTDFVGDAGTIFYDYDSGTLRMGDGVTPGGQPVNLIGTFSDIAIGNLVVNGATITTSTAEDLTISAQPGRNVNLSSPVLIHKPGTLEHIFEVKADGQIVVTVATPDNVAGAVGIIGNQEGLYQTPVTTGVMQHITGQQDDECRVYIDGVNNYAIIAGRRYNGTPAAPTAVLNNQIIMRYGSNAYNGTMWNTGGVARVQMVADEDHTAIAQGTRLEFWAIPRGSIVMQRQGYFDGTGFNADNLTTSGRVLIKNTAPEGNDAILNVTTNSSGLHRPVGPPGAIAQFTGKDGQQNFVLFDGFGIDSQARLVCRTARGTNAAPLPVESGDILGKFVVAGYGTTSFNGIDSGTLKFVATETYTDLHKGAKAVIALVPNGSNTPQDILTVTPTTVSMANNGVVEARVYLGPGTPDLAPLTFQPGPMMSVSVPGSMNYDGKIFVATPADMERGIIPAEQTLVLNAVRNLTPNTIVAQSIFGQGPSLTANTRYHYRILIQVAKNGSGSNAPVLNYSLLLGAGTSLFAHSYCVRSMVSATPISVASGSTMNNYITTGFDIGVPVTAAMPVSIGYCLMEIQGTIDVNAAGRITPQLAFSDAPNTSCSVQPHSRMSIFPVGTPGVNTTVGNWA